MEAYNLQTRLNRWTNQLNLAHAKVNLMSSSYELYVRSVLLSCHLALDSSFCNLPFSWQRVGEILIQKFAISRPVIASYSDKHG